MSYKRIPWHWTVILTSSQKVTESQSTNPKIHWFMHASEPLSPSRVSGVSALPNHFWNCRSLERLWFSLVRPATFKYRLARESESSFFLNQFLEFCLSTLAFFIFFRHLVCSMSTHLTVPIDTWKIPYYSCASLWNPRYSENSDWLEHFTSTFSLVMPFSSCHWLSFFRWQFSTCNHFHV